MMPKDRIIAFVCTGNTCRSPMAEAIFNKLAEEKGLDVRALSFGLAAVPGMPPSKNAVAVCREIGIDISEPAEKGRALPPRRRTGRRSGSTSPPRTRRTGSPSPF